MCNPKYWYYEVKLQQIVSYPVTIGTDPYKNNLVLTSL
jgi:hypothetical protein